MGSGKSCRHQRGAERTTSAALPRMRKALQLSLVGRASVANQRDGDGGVTVGVNYHLKRGNTLLLNKNLINLKIPKKRLGIAT